MTTSEPPLRELLDEVSRLHFRLAAFAERLHGRGETTSGQRALLRNLAESGPATVPQLAAARPVSRQYIQKRIDDLIAGGFAEAAPNPAHKRSALIRITPAGRKLLRDMLARERPLAGQLAAAVAPGEIAAALEVLRRLRGFVDST